MSTRKPQQGTWETVAITLERTKCGHHDMINNLEENLEEVQLKHHGCSRPEIRVLKLNINQARKELDKCQENLVHEQLEDACRRPGEDMQTELRILSNHYNVVLCILSV